MIEATNLTKRFASNFALKDMNCRIPKGCVYGLVGSNGAGKSTFLRLVTGIYSPETGQITVDDKSVFDNPSIKQNLVLVPDDPFFLPQASAGRMAKLYTAVYDRFDSQRFLTMLSHLGLPLKSNLNTFSKGMRRQVAISLALSCRPDYILFDETFDGLDPVVRNAMKTAIYEDVNDRGMTVVMSSHSLRELEDTCDQLALLHKGGIMFESDVQNLKTSLFKIQVAFNNDFGKEIFGDTEVINFSKKGSVAMAIVRGDRNNVKATLYAQNPLLVEVLPLSLEEVFVHEMDALGYAFGDILN